MIPNIRLYLDLAAGVLVVVFLGWLVHHGRVLERNAEQAASAAQVIHNQEVESRVQTRVDQIAEQLRLANAAPVLAPVHISVCHDAHPVLLSTDVSSTPGSDGGTDVPKAVGSESSSVDIGPDTDKLLDQADAQVTALQSYIRECQKEGICR